MPSQVSSILSGEGFDVAVGALTASVSCPVGNVRSLTEAAQKGHTWRSHQKSRKRLALLPAPTVVGRLLPLFALIVLFCATPEKALGDLFQG